MTFLIFFIFSPALYFYISVTEPNKRTDYPGREIAKEVKKKYDDNFEDEIKFIIGEEWHGGNLSYHLESRPKWFYVGGSTKPNQFAKFEKSTGNISTIGISDVKTSKKVLKICEKENGIFYIIKNIGFCINGKRKK